MKQRAAIALASAIAFGVIASACGGRARIPGDIGIAASAAPVSLPRITKPPDPSPAGVEEHVLLTVGEKMIGPFLARRGESLVAAYIGTGDTGGRRIVGVPLTASGEPRGDAKVVASVPNDATTLVLRTIGGERSGYAAAWTALTDRGEALSVVGIGEDGRPRGLPVELARTVDHIVWADIVPTPRGAIAVWAEETAAGDANVLAVSLAPDGGMRGVPARIARGVTGWQVTATRDGAALALVTPSAAPAIEKPAKRAAAEPAKRGTKDRAKDGVKDSAKDAPVEKPSKHAGSLSWLRLDASGAPIGSPIAIAASASVSGDIEVVRAGEAYVFAWTDTSEVDPHVALARVDDAGVVKGPVRAPDAAASLIAVTAGPAGAAIAWEDPLRRVRGVRRVYLARIDGSPAIDAKTVVALDLQGQGAVELEGTPDGFALLANARPCWQPAEACGDAPVLPTVLRFDAKLAQPQVEPLRLGFLREPATLGWGLSCGAQECLALATTSEQPARVRTVDLKPRTTAFRPPFASGGPADAPHVESVTTLGVGAFADVGAARVGDGTLVALLGTAVDLPATKRRATTSGATLSVRPVDANGVAGPAVALTKRALTVGGVAIAGGRPEDGAAVVWVAPESGDPELHASRVDRTGKRVRDRQLTTTKGDASDVAIAWVGDGWIIAWVDGRDGNGEVYATKVDRDLRRIGKETRVTHAPGDASGITLLARPDAVWIAWSDPRESPSDSFGDIYVAALRPKDATKVDAETRVLATAAHSRSPALAVTGDQVAIAWIEEAPMGADSAKSQAYGAMMAWLDPHGRPIREPGRLGTAGEGFASAVTMDGSATSVHVVLARSARESIELDALEITRDPTAHPFPLLGLDGPPSLDVSFSLLGDALYFNDEGLDPDGRRARRARIAWRR